MSLNYTSKAAGPLVKGVGRSAAFTPLISMQTVLLLKKGESFRNPLQNGSFFFFFLKSVVG